MATCGLAAKEITMNTQVSPSSFTFKTRTRLGSALLALALGASACGSSNNDSEAEEVTSPFAEFFGFDGSLDSEQQDAFIDEQREVEEVIAACMTAEGFEYIPIDYSAQIRSSINPEDGLEAGTKTYVEKYGFGISTLRWSQDAVGPDLVGNIWDDTTEEALLDPNLAYANALEPDEQEQYYASLYGQAEGPEADPSLTDEENQALSDEYYANYQPSGCASEAYANADFDGGTGLNEMFETMAVEFEDIEQRFEADPRVLQIRDDVTACALDAGYEYDTDNTSNELSQRVEDIAAMATQPSDTEIEAFDEDEFAEFLSKTESLNDQQLAALAEAQTYEIAFALAVYECGDEELTGGTTGEIAELRAEYEQEFLDEHTDKLEPFRGVAN